RFVRQSSILVHVSCDVFLAGLDAVGTAGTRRAQSHPAHILHVVMPMLLQRSQPIGLVIAWTVWKSTSAHCQVQAMPSGEGSHRALGVIGEYAQPCHTSGTCLREVQRSGEKACPKHDGAL